ncbi:MAG TPA: cardiolipin synthase, partial [Gemmataceae bacterium]|nr:cardiolipin synthase [Gemmataceae bacterium]
MLTWTWAFHISEMLIRLVMLVYVPQRRSPAAARTWLLLIFMEPILGLVLYNLFGRAYLPKRRIKIQARVSEFIKKVGPHFFAKLTRPELEPHFQQAVTLAQNLGDFGIVGGNSVELLTDYDGAINRLVADIDAATHHVHLLYYIFANDGTGRRVADALTRAARRGVTCRVLMDGLGSRKGMRALGPELRAAGVEVHEMLPVGLFRRHGSRYDLRNHRKIAVLDGRVGYAGSQNLVDAFFKKGLTFEEVVVRVTGPVVQQLQAVFLADHYLETETTLDLHKLFPEPVETGPSPAQVLPSGPGYPHANTQRLLVALVHGARERVVITTPYFVPDEPFLQAMQTAVLRGVAVHLVVSKQADQLLVGLAQRSYYEELLGSGVRIHLYHRRFLHAKHVSIDDSVALIGSSNIDIRSFALNAEVSLLLYDPQVVARLREVQEEYFAHSEL